MCKSPISIKNPLYGRASYVSEYGSLLEKPRYFASKNEFINVKCGKCQECRDSYYNSILQRGIVESLTSYMFFVTLTYDNKHLPSLTLPNGKRVYYTDYMDVQNMFKRLRARNVIPREFRYLVVNEYGDKRHRPHVHILLFLAKHKDDMPNTPYFLEKLLFDNLIKYFATNVGTRKAPIYEQLLTYRCRMTPKGMQSNYFVKYVEPTIMYNQIIHEDNSTVKSIRYILSYINKGSSFDKAINDYLNELRDPVVKKKLSYILSCRLRFSHGFGLGFIDGQKYDCPPVYKNISLLTALESDIQLPPTFAEFVEEYPTLLTPLQDLISDDAISNVEEIIDLYYNKEQILLWCAIRKYFPHYYSKKYRDNFRFVPPFDTLGYLYYFIKPYRYVRKTIHTYDDTFTPVKTFIRDGIIQGFRQRVPYLTFPIISDRGYNSLCDYYKERFTTLADYIFLYENIGVENFDEYVELFGDTIVNYRNEKAFANKVLREVEILQPSSKGIKPPKNCYDLL